MVKKNECFGAHIIELFIKKKNHFQNSKIFCKKVQKNTDMRIIIIIIIFISIFIILLRLKLRCKSEYVEDPNQT